MIKKKYHRKAKKIIYLILDKYKFNFSFTLKLLKLQYLSLKKLNKTLIGLIIF